LLINRLAISRRGGIEAEEEQPGQIVAWIGMHPTEHFGKDLGRFDPQLVALRLLVARENAGD
jgi:hypothetical protein